VLDVTGFLKFAVQMAAMFESRFNSVERLITYQQLPQEAALIIPDNRPPKDWPPRGELDFSDVWMRYRPDLDPVLKVRH
jgi:ATP-binding cassette, subfamily C (CFTR/MRP), member 1